MDKTARAALVGSVVQSVSESLKRYEDAEKENGYGPIPGNNIGVEDSKGSIIRRCRLAREELMNIIKDLDRSR